MTAHPVDLEDDFEIRLKSDAERVLADAAPDVRPGPGGRPNRAQLLRMPRSATPTNLFKHRMQPSNTSLARLAVLHGQRRGIDPFDALRELCDIVPIGSPSAREVIAA